MFIAGTFDWASTLEQGEFLCPKCGTNKTYQRKVARTFVTLYFIPIIPISGLHEFVICRGCRERFDTLVLTASRMSPAGREPQALNAAGSFDEELLRVMALIIVDDDFVTEPEIAMAQRMYQSMLMARTAAGGAGTRLSEKFSTCALTPCATLAMPVMA